MIEIKESESNRFYRRAALFIATLIITMGTLLLLFLLIFYFMGVLPLHDFPLIMIGLLLMLAGLHFRKRVSRISAIGENALELATANKRLLLSNKNIVSILKMVRFSLTERVWLIITFINNKGKKERWLFQTEPGMSIVEKLVKMDLKLKNFP